LKKLNVGIVGLGTVGGGTYTVLTRNADEIARRIGVDVKVAQVADKDLARVNELTKGAVTATDDAFILVSSPDVDVVVELIGGYTIAKEVVLKAIENGKHVVTANKALIAVHGNEIFAAAKQAGVMVAYEAAVAGGIPIIKALREGLAANQHEWVVGILNGTTNYILTEMRDHGLAYQDVIGEAQRLGYAEADPTFDVEGIDAAHKLCIMASCAFGIPLQFDALQIEGIGKITLEDIDFASELGYTIKHLGIAKRTDRGIDLRVHYGAGAGAEPTASAVVADLVDVARMMSADESERPAALGYQVEQVQDLPVLPITEVNSAYYLRLHATDQPGVVAEVTKILGDQSISIDAMIQKEHAADTDQADIVILTHMTVEKNIDTAIANIEALAAITGSVVKLRMETLG